MRLRTTTVVLAMSVGALFAQDPPSRIARLNWLNGNVSFQPAQQPGDSNDWAEATLNYPLTSGDHLYTAAGARAEMHVGPNAIRLNGETNFGFQNLDDRAIQIRFTEGAMEVRVRDLEPDDSWEIDTPNAAITLLRAGDYRIDTDPNRNATMVTVFGGDAQVFANGAAVPVHPRQTGYFADGAAADVRGGNSPDDFDLFTRDRNTREDRVPPPVHVSQSMVGYEDLDAYGVWRETPDFGWVWAPRVTAGWTPYHVGRWVWVRPWGWTWVDEEPWGFAPFHYGRWASVGGSWVWAPGTLVARPVYAPALVAWVGAGSGVAWFALGPREVYRPAYAVSANYVRQVNLTHATNLNVNVTNVRYANQQVPGAVTSVPRESFASARPVRQVAQPVDSRQMAQAQVLSGGPGVQPQRQSIVGGGRPAAVRPRAELMNRQVVTRNTAAQQTPQGSRPAPMDRPAPVTRPTDRLDTRPPNARPLPNVDRPVQNVGRPPQNPDRPVPAVRPAPEVRQIPEARPAQEPRPVPDVRPRPAEQRPVPQHVDAPRPEAARPVPEARPERPARPEPRAAEPRAAEPRKAERAARREEKKEEKKDK